MTTSEPLLPATFLFHFSCPLRYCGQLAARGPGKLGEEFRVPSFGELEGRQLFAELRGAWSEDGLGFWLRVVGKKHPPWCRATRLEDSDGLHLWIETRATQNIHRAGRFSHRFVFMPAGEGRGYEQPTAQLVPINRAREHPKPPPAGSLKVRRESRIDGYLLEAVIRASALTGYDPREQPRLGFSYAVVDRELGWQTFGVGRELPFEEDPSLWGSLSLEA